MDFLVLVDNSMLLMLSGFITGLDYGFLFPSLNTLMIRNESGQIHGKINGIFTGSIGLGYIGEWFGYKSIFISTFLMLTVGLIFFFVFFRKVIR